MGQVFYFVLECLSQVVNFFRNVMIDEGLSYFSLLLWIGCVGLLLQLLRFIRDDNDKKEKFLLNKKWNSEYREYQNTLKRYDKEKKEGGQS